MLIVTADYASSGTMSSTGLQTSSSTSHCAINTPHHDFPLDITSRNSYILSMKTTVSEKGQVTIPKPLRERLGIRPGHVLDFHEEKGRLVAAKTTPEDPVASVYGILKLGRSTNDVMTSLRGKADTA